MEPKFEMTVTMISTLDEVAKDEWNELAISGYPFLRYEFLHALETCGCVSETTGWISQHLLLRQNGLLVAALPLYKKLHSRGEYVFDDTWAHAYERFGLHYYPKWLTAIPFTPCAGPRLILREGLDAAQVMGTFAEYMEAMAEQEGISTWHCLFAQDTAIEQLEELGFLVRQGVQFQWRNQGYSDFEGYLATFSSKKRKNVKRERRRVGEEGIELRRIIGPDISEQDWQAFYQFYQVTYLKRRMAPYLNFEFFQQIAATMADQLLLVVAIKDQQYVGAALSFIGEDTLYGRYWGCLDEYSSLHFEACYYQGLEYCIDNKLQRFDSGAQGEHKISRGFEPITTYSAHWIRDAEFQAPIADFLQREKMGLESYKEDAQAYLPFKQCEL